MRRAAALALISLGLSAASALAATMLGGGVQDGGGAPLASATRRLAGSVSQLATAASSGSARVLRHGFWNSGAIVVLAVDDGPAGAPPPPTRLEFGSPVPNPSKGATRFALALPAPAHVGLEVFDVSGRKVAVLATGELPAGRWTLEWPGRSATGEVIQPGVYFARASVDGRVLATRRVLRVR